MADFGGSEGYIVLHWSVQHKESQYSDSSCISALSDFFDFFIVGLSKYLFELIICQWNVKISDRMGTWIMSSFCASVS